MNPAILFVIGASGAGKTAAVDALEQQNLSGVGCYHFDSIAVPSADVMEQEWGGGERWQDQMTRRWIERLATNADRVQIAVLEGQTRSSEPAPWRASCSHSVAGLPAGDSEGAPRRAASSAGIEQ
jgi:hypothetical protein